MYRQAVVKLSLMTVLTGLSIFILTSGSALAQSCSSFQSCAHALASYRSGNTKLDRDKDGIPCEKLCGSNGENMPR